MTFNDKSRHIVLMTSNKISAHKIEKPYSWKIWWGITCKFGSLAVLVTAKLKIRSYLHIYVWRSLSKPPNLNPPIFLKWRFGVEPPNLIPANISGYTVIVTFVCSCLDYLTAKSSVSWMFSVHLATQLTSLSYSSVSVGF